MPGLSSQAMLSSMPGVLLSDRPIPDAILKFSGNRRLPSTGGASGGRGGMEDEAFEMEFDCDCVPRMRSMLKESCTPKAAEFIVKINGKENVGYK